MAYTPPEILVPVVRQVPGLGYIPTALAPHVMAAARGHEDVDTLTHEMGRDYVPTRPILVYNPDSKELTVMIPTGETMAELQDRAHEQIERNNERIRKTGTIFDWDGMRERRGAAKREEVRARFAEAIEERRKRHLANPVTDPAPKWRYADNGSRTFFMGGNHAS